MSSRPLADLDVAVPDGFPGERLRVMPGPAVRAAMARPITRALLVTDCGYFPHAKAHGRNRPGGTAEAVIIVCTAGSGWLRLGDDTAPATPVGRGQAVLIPPGTPHAYGADPDDPWTIWWLHAAGADVAELLSNERGTGAVASESVFVPRDPLRAVDLIGEAIDALDRDLTETSLLTAAGAAWHLLALLAASPVRPAGRMSGPGDDAASPADRVEQVAEYLRRHPERQTSVGELAALVHLSPSHLAALFREQTGTSVLRYAIDVRMSLARYLLDTTSGPVAGVARRCGYDDPFYFSRQFKRLHGLTPRGYRNQRKG